MPFADLPDSVQAEYERIGRERELVSRQADRDRRWELLRVCGELVAWTALGLVVAGFAFRVTDVQLGMVFLYGGMVINVAGIAYAIASAHVRGERRGDW
jgi:hypothetical protein